MANGVAGGHRADGLFPFTVFRTFVVLNLHILYL